MDETSAKLKVRPVKETVYATGGHGNPKLLSWSFKRRTYTNIEYYYKYPDGIEVHYIVPEYHVPKHEIDLGIVPKTVRRKGRIIRYTMKGC